MTPQGEAALHERPDAPRSTTAPRPTTSVDRVADLTVIRTVPPTSRVRRALVWGSLIYSDLLAAGATGIVAAGLAPVTSAGRWVVALGVLIGWPSVAALAGSYARVRRAALVDARGAATTATVVSLIVIIGAGLTGSDAVLVWATALIGAALARWLSRSLIGVYRRRGDLAETAVIVGTSARAGDLAHDLRDHDPSLRPIGFVATGGPLVSPNGLAVLGSIEHLADLIERYDVERVVVPPGELDRAQTASLVDVARRAQVDVVLAQEAPSMRATRSRVEPLGDGVGVAVVPPRLSPRQRFFKRSVDVVLGMTLLLMAAPLMAIIAVFVRLGSAGPVIFRQERVTKDGATFTMLKFRTMVADAEERLDDRDRHRAFFKRADDERITAIGRILRRLSLDELPQLINIVRGDMSLVGPRPLPAPQVAANPALLGPRLEVRAGLTGWWQVNGRNDRDLDESLTLDLYYIRNWSVLLDLYILWRTAAHMIDRRGAM